MSLTLPPPSAGVLDNSYDALMAPPCSAVAVVVVVASATMVERATAAVTAVMVMANYPSRKTAPLMNPVFFLARPSTPRTWHFSSDDECSCAN